MAEKKESAALWDKGGQQRAGQKNNVSYIHSNLSVTKSQELDYDKEERAAIFQFDGGLSRIEAERQVFGKAILCRRPFDMMADHGGKFLPFYNSKASVGKWSERADLTQLLKWRNQGFDKFYLWLPKSFLIIDLDQKGGKDGVAELKKIIPGFNPETSPAYTRTKHGYHIFFKSSGLIFTHTAGILPGVDIRGQYMPVTSPGSLKNGFCYEFFGDLADAPLLPFKLRELLKINSRCKTYRQLEKPICKKSLGNNPNLEKMAEWLERQTIGKNEFLYRLANWAVKENIGYKIPEFIRARYGYDPADQEIKHAIRACIGAAI